MASALLAFNVCERHFRCFWAELALPDSGQV